MIDKALLARIRKCLALSASSNENEAAAALAKARELMREHGITDEQLRLAEIEEATARASRNQRPPAWENYLDAAVRYALDVHSFIDANGDRRFVGRGAAPEVAAYAFAVLFRQLKKARAAYISARLKRCKPGRKRQRADVFCEGWAAAVLNKIAAISPAPTAAEDEDVQRYLVAQYPSLVPVDARKARMKGGGVHNDYWSGCSAGNAVELHSGVGSAGAPLALA